MTFWTKLSEKLSKADISAFVQLSTTLSISVEDFLKLSAILGNYRRNYRYRKWQENYRKFIDIEKNGLSPTPTHGGLFLRWSTDGWLATGGHRDPHIPVRHPLSYRLHAGVTPLIQTARRMLSCNLSCHINLWDIQPFSRWQYFRHSSRMNLWHLQLSAFPLFSS